MLVVQLRYVKLFFTSLRYHPKTDNNLISNHPKNQRRQRNKHIQGPHLKLPFLHIPYEPASFVHYLPKYVTIMSMHEDFIEKHLQLECSYWLGKQIWDAERIHGMQRLLSESFFWQKEI